MAPLPPMTPDESATYALADPTTHRHQLEIYRRAEPELYHMHRHEALVERVLDWSRHSIRARWGGTYRPASPGDWILLKSSGQKAYLCYRAIPSDVGVAHFIARLVSVSSMTEETVREIEP